MPFSHCHLLTETFEKSQLFAISPCTPTPFYATLFKSFKIVYVIIGINYGESRALSRYGWEYGIPAYAVAIFVAFSRVQAKQHYVHDVIAGAAIGIGSSYLLTQPYKGWCIQADIDTKFCGVRLNRSW